jgi:two-component system sensor histidine kinase DegS
MLVDLGFPAALKSLAEEQQRHGRDVAISISDVAVDLPLATGLALYRIAQEALRNAAKHARGAPVRIKLEVVGNELRLSIEDAGSGFDLTAIRNTGGLGLISMKERAMLAGGHLLIRTKPGDGTSVYVYVPLEAG